MGHASLRQAVESLERDGDLLRVRDEVSAHLEVGEIQRRVYRAGGPAILFERVAGTPFPMLGNLFGTRARMHRLFGRALDDVASLVDAKVDPRDILRHFSAAARLPAIATHLLPLPLPSFAAPSLAETTRLSLLPKLVSWPDDGGPFITLPQVYTEDPAAPGVRRSNLGMYRVQLAGNDYVADREVGLHYQIHRGIGVHHAAAIAGNARLPVAIFVGGPPAMTLAAVMPLPEGLPEIAFAGALNGRSVRMSRVAAGEAGAGQSIAVHADADFVLRGFIEPHETKPEGPFGDHLGYYAKTHNFPLMHVTHVTHRRGAIWPFTTVGRPPQEDTSFGAIIHEMTKKLVPTVLPGVTSVHAVDAAGVHPLLLAVGSERYVPYADRARPMELLTQANAILGQGQMSLAKYLFIVAREDGPPDLHDVRALLRHLLERFDSTRDLHFQTRTTIDTLDYSGTGLNEGSKLVIAAVGAPKRTLATSISSALTLPDGFTSPRFAMEGVLVVQAPPSSGTTSRVDVDHFCAHFSGSCVLDDVPLIVLVDDSENAARTVDDFVWTTFTRSNPAADVHGIDASTDDKHWGCRGPVVIDARRKPHHAPPLVDDPAVVRRVDAMRSAGGALADWL